MIVGLTNNPDLSPVQVTQYCGKISTGFQPGGSPTGINAPRPAGYFRIMKRVQTTRREGGKTLQIQQWALNEEIQKKLEEACGTDQPRRLDAILRYFAPSDNWETYIGKYSSTEGLLCKSQGAGTTPTEYFYDDKGKKGKRVRMFDGVGKCPYKECPDYKNGLCSEYGILKVFPLVDLRFEPYQFVTRSIHSILYINAAIYRMFMLRRMAFQIISAKKKDAVFNGLAFTKYRLVHRKIKSGGRDVFISQMEVDPKENQVLMSIVQKGVDDNLKYMLEDLEKIVNLPGFDTQEQIEQNQTLLPSELLSIEDEKLLAAEFPAREPAETAKEQPETAENTKPKSLEKILLQQLKKKP